MYIINAVYERDKIVDWIKEYFVNNGNAETKAVIGISGGKDSTVAAALLVRALGRERVVGVIMPNGYQSDIEDSYKVCDMLGIKPYVVNIEDVYESYLNICSSFITNNFTPQLTTNIPPRIRMTVLYMVAAAVGGRVCNTGNASELYVGYTTKYGDLAGDFSLFRDYYVRDVISIGLTMEEIPSSLVVKAPGDGLTGKTDEDNLGFSYETLDAYILDSVVPNYDVLRSIENKHKTNLHKKCLNIPYPHVKSRHLLGTEWKEDYAPF